MIEMMKTLTRFVVANILIAIVIVSTFALIALHRFRSEAVKDAGADLEKCLLTTWELLRVKGKEFRIEDGKLFAGDYPVNETCDFPETIGKIFGGVATVFVGDTSVATNILTSDGKPAVGAKIEGPPGQAIFGEGRPYRGEETILGNRYLTAYDPIRNRNGEVVGALLVGVKRHDFLAAANGVRMELSLLLAGLVVVFSILMAILGRATRRHETSKESQRDFAESLVRDSAVPTFVIDLRHKVIMWNRACEELTGLKATEVVGTDNQWLPFYKDKRPVLADIVIDGNFDELSALYGNYLRSPLTPDGIQAEGWYASLGGSERFIFFDAAPVRDKEGNVIAAIETLQDITERKRAEDSLRKLSQAIEQSPATVMITDREGIIQYVNPYFTRVTGYSAEEAVGQTPRILQSGQHQVELYRELWETIISGGEWRGEICNRKKDGRLCWAACSISPVKNGVGEITHFIAVQEDVTEKKRAEEDLKKSNDQVRLLLESTGEAIYGVDLAGNCTFANPACARLLGYEHPDRMLGKNMHQLIHHTRHDGTGYPEAECPMYRVLHGEGGAHSDSEILWRADGTSFPAEFWSYPQLNGDRVVGAVVTFFDISERKQREVELRRAMIEAEAATRAKSDFLANMSHEIRTPMNAVMGMLYLLQQTVLTDKQRQYLFKAQGASHSLLRIINDILDFSKVEAGKLEMESASFHLDQVLENVLTVAIAAIKDRPLEIVVTTAPDVPDCLVGDSLRLGQVLLNLTSNAIKFSSEGTIRVSVERTLASGNEVALQFSVEDQGIGIPEEQQARLFSAFTQADTSTTRRYGGTGLGLTISKQLVELMGGSLTVRSRPGKGSVFVFTACFGSVADPAGDTTGTCGGNDAVEDTFTFVGVRVLLVEDNPVNQEVAREILAGRGVTVDVAANGYEAVERLTGSGAVYDAVLMDVQMPVMDGLEATRRIRADERFASLPIIAMTASAMSADRVLCMDAGMNDQVNKPVDVPELFATLAKWTNRGAPPGEEELETVAEPCSLRSLPAGLTGIDFPVALARLGSASLLRQLLMTFGKENAGTAEALRQALQTDDIPTAIRLVHTVKGVGGNLGVNDVHAAAHELETALRNGDRSHIRPCLTAFEQALGVVLVSIRSLERMSEVPNLTATVQSSPDERERIAHLSDELAVLVKANSLSALRVWEELKPHVPGHEGTRLDSAMNSLDFREAGRILEGLAGTLGRAA